MAACHPVCSGKPGASPPRTSTQSLGPNGKRPQIWPDSTRSLRALSGSGLLPGLEVWLRLRLQTRCRRRAGWHGPFRLGSYQCRGGLLRSRLLSLSPLATHHRIHHGGGTWDRHSRRAELNRFTSSRGELWGRLVLSIATNPALWPNTSFKVTRRPVTQFAVANSAPVHPAPQLDR